MRYDIERYLNVRQAYNPSFVADGTAVLFISNITDAPQAWRAQLNDTRQPAWPEQLTFGAERVLTLQASPLAGDGRLIYGRDRGGNENVQLFLLDPDTGVERALTEGWERSLHMPGQWSDDASRLLFAANRRDPALFDLYVQQLDGDARLVWQNDTPGFLYVQHFSPDGRRAVVVRAASNAEHHLLVVDLERGTATSAWSGLPARFPFADWDAGGNLLLLTDAGSDWLYLARLDIASGELEPLLQLDWDINIASLSPSRERVALVVNEGGQSRPHIYDLQSDKPPRAAQLDIRPGVTAGLDERLAWSRDGRYLSFSYTAATRSADIWVWDAEEARVWPATRSSHGGLPTGSFVAPELIHYPTFDERKIPAWLFTPRDAQTPLPAVVVVHGGPESQFGSGFNFLVQYLTGSGYAVLAPNVRGSSGYGKQYSHLDDVRKRMDSVADLAHAAHWLRDRADIDGDRIAVYGGSYGGFMVLAALTTYPELWAAGVDIVGISNWVTFLQNTSSYRRAHREAEYGSLEHDREFLESISPLNHLDNIRAPLMVLHGANDPRVPLGEAQQLAERLKARGVPVELLVFDDEGHGIVRLRNKLAAYPAIVGFLDRRREAPASRE